MVGDGSYLMMNSELATSVMLGLKLTIVLLDNRGYGCINRLQRATGGESFNNLLQHTRPRDAARDRLRRPCGKPRRARRSRSTSIAELETALQKARSDATAPRSSSSTPIRSIATDAGGHWWDVAVPEVSVRAAGERRPANHYENALGAQRVGD